MKKYVPSLVPALATIISVLSLFTSGCASRSSSIGTGNFRLSEENKISAVTISVNQETKAILKGKDYLKFDPEALRQHVESSLSPYAVRDTAGHAPLPRVEIVILKVRMRSTLPTMLWGELSGPLTGDADLLAGDIIIKNAADREIGRFVVSASYAAGGLSGGRESVRLKWLYQAFAKETLKILTENNRW